MKEKIFVLATMTFLFLAAMPGFAQNSEKGDQSKSVSDNLVEVYYFHFERRCATCTAVENESEKALKELYPEKVRDGEISFISVNLEDDSNRTLADKLKVSGQTLLIVKGDKQDNLTNIAFMNARTNPEKLKKAIKESIEKL